MRTGSVMSVTGMVTGRRFRGITPPRNDRGIHKRRSRARERRRRGRASDDLQANRHGISVGPASRFSQGGRSPIPGVNAFSAPVFDHSGSIALAITAIGPSGISTYLDGPMAKQLLECAGVISNSTWLLFQCGARSGLRNDIKSHSHLTLLIPAEPRKMTLNISFYLAAIPAVTLLGMSKGGFAGVGMLGLPLMALAIPPLQAAANDSSHVCRYKTPSVFGYTGELWDAPKFCRFCCPAPRWEWSISSGIYWPLAFRMQGVSLAVGLLSSFLRARD